MEFEHILINITEIFHKSIEKYKQETLCKKEFSLVTISQLFYIEAIFQLGTPTFSEIANKLMVSKASVTAAINKLVKQKLVTKIQSHDDKRIFYIQLTPNGKALIESELKSLTSFGNMVRNALNKDELDQLTQIASKIIKYHNAG